MKGVLRSKVVSNKKTNLLFKNYMTMVENSVGSRMFRSFFANINGEEKEVLKEGRLSCAVVASSILYLFNSVLEFSGKSCWIDFVHANVPSTEKDMIQNGWHPIHELRPGAILVWEKRSAHGSQNWHIGFYIGDELAISNDSGLGHTGVPHQHHYTYQDTRKIEKIYWHPELDA